MCGREFDGKRGEEGEESDCPLWEGGDKREGRYGRRVTLHREREQAPLEEVPSVTVPHSDGSGP